MELQDLWLAAGMACAHLSPPALTLVPLTERLWALPSHLERVVVECAFFTSSMALERMVSHFDEIDLVVIVECFAAGRSDEELDQIESQVLPHT